MEKVSPEKPARFLSYKIGGSEFAFFVGMASNRAFSGGGGPNRTTKRPEKTHIFGCRGV